MKKIIVKKMSFLNFKGLRNYEVEFNADETRIYGKNGVGKSTIFDGFTWLLFGKNSEDKAKFGVRTYDANGNIIPKIPHEVTAFLSVNGEDIKLSRKFIEKWVKKRGSYQEEYAGNGEELYYNEVPCSLKEWNEKIKRICDEQVFKFITNPLHFTSQNAKVQREMLFRMAGGVSDDDIANGNEEFAKLLGSLTGKTMDEYRKEINAKKRVIKSDIDGIPQRIDERKRDVPASENWSELETKLVSLKTKIEDIEERMLDSSKLYEDAVAKRSIKVQKLGDVRRCLAERKSDIEMSVFGNYHNSEVKRQEILTQISTLETERQTHFDKINELGGLIDECVKRREELISEWRNINAEKLTFNTDEFICPLCKRQLEIEDIESKQEELTRTFNENKARMLSANQSKGKENNSQKESYIAMRDAAKQDIQACEDKITRLKQRKEFKSQSEKPDATPLINNDSEYQALLAREQELMALINEPTQKPDDTALRNERAELVDQAQSLTTRLNCRQIIEANNKRIAELEWQYKEMRQELAELEHTEYVMHQFSKAKTAAIEGKINALFDNVKFKLFDTQINGAEVETCEALINGVPISDANTAAKINAGIDIINAICKFEQISAPIFADGAESINILHGTESQMIKLYVSEDNELTIR